MSNKKLPYHTIPCILCTCTFTVKIWLICTQSTELVSSYTLDIRLYIIIIPSCLPAKAERRSSDMNGFLGRQQWQSALGKRLLCGHGNWLRKFSSGRYFNNYIVNIQT